MENDSITRKPSLGFGRLLVAKSAEAGVRAARLATGAVLDAPLVTPVMQN